MANLDLTPSDPGTMRLSVRLRMRTTVEGGRKTPVWSGYRPDWNFGPLDRDTGGLPDLHGAPIIELDVEMLAPGDEGVAMIQPIAPQGWTEVVPGSQLYCHEGPRVVGTAVVLTVLRDA